MTTDITELAHSLKAAAEGVIKNYDCEWFETGRQICTVHKSKINLISLANPANVLALVEALEKEQQVDEELCKLLPLGAEYMDPPDGGDVEPIEQVRRMVADYRQRIAEMEPRAVTVSLPDIMPPEAAPAHYWDPGESMAYADGYNKSAADLKTSFAQACSSAGVNVEFE